MLQQLYIKNVVLIDEATIEFEKGLNVISGETGTGKSIVIGSLSFVLGSRATKDFIKKGEEYAMVSALLTIDTESMKEDIKSLGVGIDDDASVLISRNFNKNGRNTCKINGKPATLGMIKEICEKLIDIHGQHEHQSLLEPSKHILLLDRFCEEKLEIPKKKLFEQIEKYKLILKEIKEISMGKDREELASFFSYQIEEIENAKLSEDEEKEIAEKRSVLSEAEKLKELYASSIYMIDSLDEQSVIDKMGIALKNIEKITKIDVSKGEIYNELHEIYDKIQDISRSLKIFNDEIEYDENLLNDIEERLDTIQKLKKKYGQTIPNIILFKEETAKKLENLTNGEQKIANLHKEKNNIEKQIKKYCLLISEIRKEKAKYLEENIKSHLSELGMKDTEFKIDIKNKGSFNQNGYDKVEFMIRTNVGEDVKPLSKIASGGEMSRIMLSLKAVLSFADTIDTFIFDEIDTGISGRTAQMVAEKMSILAKNNQIICITHLPQIATMGDWHFLIDKNVLQNNTNTKIIKLKEDEIIKEISRMIGGATITESTLLTAKEMREQAKNIKSKKI